MGRKDMKRTSYLGRQKLAQRKKRFEHRSDKKENNVPFVASGSSKTGIWAPISSV